MYRIITPPHALSHTLVAHTSQLHCVTMVSNDFVSFIIASEVIWSDSICRIREGTCASARVCVLGMPESCINVTKRRKIAEANGEQELQI